MKELKELRLILCSMCKLVADKALLWPCCQIVTCSKCAKLYFRANRLCFKCGAEMSLDSLIEDVALQEKIQKVINLIYLCCICREHCKRAVYLPCCPKLRNVCRGCGIKHVTSKRSCWSCGQRDKNTSNFGVDEEVRACIGHYKDKNEHQFNVITELLHQGKAHFFPRSDNNEGEGLILSNGVDEDDIVELESVVRPPAESRDRNEVRIIESPCSDTRHDKERWRRAHNKTQHSSRDGKSSSRAPSHSDHDDSSYSSGHFRSKPDSRQRQFSHTDRDKHCARRSEAGEREEVPRDRRDVQPTASLGAILSEGVLDSSSSRGNGRRKSAAHFFARTDGTAATKEVTGSFVAMQRKRLAEETAIIEAKVKQKIEDHIAGAVAQILEANRVAIEREIMERLALAKQRMEEEVRAEMKRLEEAREVEQARRTEWAKAIALKEEERRKEEEMMIAERRLALVEKQMRQEEAAERERKRAQRKDKMEQLKILGKDQSRPKLSFSISNKF